MKLPGGGRVYWRDASDSEWHEVSGVSEGTLTYVEVDWHEPSGSAPLPHRRRLTEEPVEAGRVLLGSVQGPCRCVEGCRDCVGDDGLFYRCSGCLHERKAAR